MKRIEKIKELNLTNLGNLFLIELIPNDGNIYEGIGEAVITYNEECFNLHIFEGIFKKQYIKSLEYKFADIKDVEFGKYGFKHPYVQIYFEKDLYLVFSYYLKIKNFSNQEENIKHFFNILGEIEVQL